MMNILNELFDQSIAIFENFLLIYFMTKHFGYKEKRGNIWISIFAVIGLYIMVRVAVSVESLEMIMSVGAIVFLALYSTIFLKGSVIKKVILSILLFIMIAIINMLVMEFYSISFAVESSYVMSSNSFINFAAKVSTKIVFLVLGNILFVQKKDTRISLSGTEMLIIVSLFCAILSITLLIYNVVKDNVLENNHKAMLVGIIVILVVIISAIYFLMLQLSAYNHKKKELDLLEVKKEEQENTIIAIEESYRRLKTLRHDAKHYFTLIAGLIELKEYEKVKELIKEVNEVELVYNENVIIKDRPIINAIINTKIEKAKNNGIEFKYNILSDFMDVSEKDMSILLANLLDNAIEASMKCDNKKEIYLDIYNSKNYLQLLIKNTVIDPVMNKNPMLKTTKNDKSSHGLGLLSIKNIIKKYDGMFQFYDDNSYFVTDIALKKKK